MAYRIYQKAGKLADAALEYTSLRLAGDMTSALAVYRQATGDDRPMGIYSMVRGTLPVLDDSWWVYNADDVIRSAYRFTSREWDRVLDYQSEEARAYNMCHLAERKHGGTWTYQYEY